jgi:TorA maturation chaperone TorD
VSVKKREDPTLQVQAMLERVYRCGTLAGLFAYPDQEQGEMLYSALATLMTRCDTEENEARRALAAFVAAWDESDGGALRAEYARLFLGRTPCPLHSTAYGSAGVLSGPAAELADISGFYQAFGIDVREDAPERPDHLSVELEFYATLLAKEAYACFNGWSEREAVTRDAARDFLNDHLGRWRGVLTERLERHDAATPFPEAARWLDRFLKQECHIRGVAPQPYGGTVEDHMQADCLICPESSG